MADNYQQFSQMLPELTADEVAWLEEQLQPIVVHGGREFPEGDPAIDESASDPDFTGPRFLRDNPDFDGRYDELGFESAFQDEEGGGRSLWLHADGYGNPDHAAWLVHKFLKRFRPDQCWSLTGVAMVLDDGTTVYAARDGEGNDAGALHGATKSDEEFVLPELTIG